MPLLWQARTISDVDYANDIAFLADTPAQNESMHYSLEKAAGIIGFHVNADKTDICALIKKKKKRHPRAKSFASETNGQIHILLK